MQVHSGNANPITEPVNQDHQQHRGYSICSGSRKKLEEITELNEGIVDRVSAVQDGKTHEQVGFRFRCVSVRLTGW
jgi:hypothetical protein